MEMSPMIRVVSDDDAVVMAQLTLSHDFFLTSLMCWDPLSTRVRRHPHVGVGGRRPERKKLVQSGIEPETFCV